MVAENWHPKGITPYYADDYVFIINADCREILPQLPDRSIDLVLCDLPYGTTACKWDTIIPLEPLWEEYKRIIKGNRAIVLTASQPFTSVLVMSNLKMFKYEWIWKKNAGSNFATTKYQPMKEHESILVFGNGSTLYNQQRQPRADSGFARQKTPLRFDRYQKDGVYGDILGSVIKKRISKDRCPSSVQYFNRERGLHPTQKPVALFEYLIKTYSNEGDLVLDNCAGSGTTLLAALNTGRKCIGIEIEEKYCEIAAKRCQQSVFQFDVAPNNIASKQQHMV